MCSARVRTRPLFCLLVGVLSAASAFGQLIFVNRTDDAAPNSGGNSGDLRNAILQANASPGSTVQILSTVSGITITLQAPLPILTAGMTINKVSGTVTVNGNNQHRIFFIDAPGSTVTIQDLTLANGRAKGGDGGLGGGGGGLGAGGAIFVNRGTVSAERLVFSNNQAIGGKGADSGGLGGGGGGGLGGNGGAGANYVDTTPRTAVGGGGGGGFRGNGGASGGGAGGGGGIQGAGGVGSSSSGLGTGGGGGAIGQGGAAIGATGGGGDPGGGGQGASISPSAFPSAGSTNGGGGGGGNTIAGNPAVRYGGGLGGRFGGGGAGWDDGGGGGGGEFGGGGGNADAYGGAGSGGWGGGGGGGANHNRFGNHGQAGFGAFGGGGGGAAFYAVRGTGGSYGGDGGGSNDENQMSGGGGGAGLGGAVFVRSPNGASFSMTDCSISGGSAQGGAGGNTVVASGAVAPTAGQGRGSAVFIQASSLSFTGSGTISETLDDDENQAATPLTKSGAGTLVLSNPFNTYRGTTTITGGTLSAALLAHPNNPSSIGSGTSVALSGNAILEYTGSANITTSKNFTFGNGGIGVTNPATTLELIGSLGGSGAFTKAGPGTILLNSVATYFSNTIISGGTLEVGPFGALGGTSGLSSVFNNGLLSFHRDDPAGTTFDKSISGTGGVRVRGFYTLKLTGGNSYTGDTLLEGGTLEVGHNTALGGSGGNYGTIRISAGTRLRAADGARTLPHPVQVLGDFSIGRLTTLTGPITLSGASVNISSGNTGGSAADADTVFSGAVSGPSQLVVSNGTGWGTGALALYGANTYTGGTFIRDLARVAVLNDSGLGAAGTTLTLEGYLRLDGNVSGTRQLSLTGNFAEIETGGRSVTFGSIGSGGTVFLRGGGTLALGSGTFSGRIGGEGKLLKVGTGTLTLSNFNDFNGGLTIQDGVVAYGANQSLGTGDIRIEGGGLRSTGTILAVGSTSIFLAGNFSLGRNVHLGACVLVIPAVTVTIDNPDGPSNADTQFVGVISGSGAMTFAAGSNGMGTGAVTFNNANTYTGGTTISAGVRVRPFNDQAFGAAGTPLALGTGGRLSLVGGFASARPLSLLAGGGEIESAGNTATFPSLDGTGPLLLSGGGQLQISSGTYSGVLSGNGSLAKQGTGTLTLSGANTYSGGTSMPSGILGIGDNAALGTGTLTIGGGNIRAVNNTRFLANAVTVNASFTLGRSTFFDGNASFPASGTITLTGDNPDGPADADSGFRGPISGGAALTIASSGNGLGTGAIVFYGANTFTGAVTVGAGARLGINSDSSLGGAGSTLTLRNGGKLRIDGTMASSRTINLQTGGGELESNATSTFGNLSGTAAFTITGGANTGFSGTLNHAGNITHNGTGRLQINTGTLSGVFSGTGELLKNAATTLTLSADNTHSGTTTVAGGTLVLSGQSASTAFGISSGAVLELAVASGERDYVPGSGTVTFSGGGTLRKTGAGTARWNSAAATFALAAGSLIDVQAGTFVGGSFANEVWTGNLSGLNVAAGAEFNGVEANVRVDALSGGGTIRSGFGGAGYSTFTFGVNNGSGTFAGTLSDNGGSPANFTKAGTGTQILTGANTHTGGTVVNIGGTLQIGNNGATGSIVGNIANAGTLAFRRSDSSAFAGGISGAGAVSHGGGTLTLSGPSSATGTLSILSGRVILSGSYAGGFNATGRLSLAGGSIGSASASSVVQPGGQLDGSGTILGSVANSGLLTAGPGETLTFSGGAVTNAGGAVLRAIGGGTLNFSGASSLVNNGLIDRISGTITFPASFTNNGVLLDSSVIQVKTASRAGNVITVTIQGYAAHSYRLQKSTDLGATTFVNVGSAQSGAGAELTFNDTDASAHAFYRVAVD